MLSRQRNLRLKVQFERTEGIEPPTSDVRAPLLYQLSYALIYENKIAIITNNIINIKYAPNKTIGIHSGQNTHSQENVNTPVNLSIDSIIVNVVAESDIFILFLLTKIRK